MLEKAKRHFRDVDPVLGSVVDIIGNIKLRYRPANFESFVRIIVNQQLSNRAAKTIFLRIKTLASPKRVTPESLEKIGYEKLKGCGLSKGKTEYVLDLAGTFKKNPGYITKLKKMDTDEVLESLTSHRGIGIWSADIFRLFNFRQHDVFPQGDASLEKAISLLYGINIDKKYSGIEDLICLWSPYKSFASLYLWEWLDQGQPELF